MDFRHIASFSFIAACIFISVISQTPGAFMCLGISIILFGFILWLDRTRIDDRQKIFDEISTLKDKISAIQISRLGGR